MVFRLRMWINPSRPARTPWYVKPILLTGITPSMIPFPEYTWGSNSILKMPKVL